MRNNEIRLVDDDSDGHYYHLSDNTNKQLRLTIENSIFTSLCVEAFDAFDDDLMMGDAYEIIDQVSDDFKIFIATFNANFIFSFNPLEYAKLELDYISNILTRGCLANYYADEYFTYSMIRVITKYYTDDEHNSSDDIQLFSILKKLPAMYFSQLSGSESFFNPTEGELAYLTLLQAIIWYKEFLTLFIQNHPDPSFSLYFSAEPSFLLKAFKKKSTSYRFNTYNPNKTIPALHKALSQHNLIKDEGLDSFKAAFLKGEGSIYWAGKQNQLGYFVAQMKTKGITLNSDNLKAANAVFLVNDKAVHESNLKSGAAQLNQKGRKWIDGIIEEILTTH